MSAFVIVDTKIHDAEGYERYKALARPIAEQYGGRYLVRGGEMDVVDEQLWSPTRVVVVEFPDMDSARRFNESDEYAPVKALRHRYADSTLLIVSGE